ncbi:hypothetical protein LINPERPRIM_LOCUS33523 [Linum perenne]
MLRLSNGGSEI